MPLLIGTTAECLQHLKEILPGEGQQQLAARKTIAKFTGVEHATVRRWINEGIPPQGKPLLHLRYYLEFLGYHVQELQSLNQEIRDAVRLFAFRIVALSQIAQYVGYPDGKAGVKILLALMRGEHGAPPHKLGKFKEFAELYGKGLPAVLQMTPKIPLYTTTECISDRAIVPATNTTTAIRDDVLVESLAGLVKALIPLARAISSDEFTAEQRARLRALAGGDSVFTLANLLYRLCGERSRTMHPDNKEGAQ